MAFFFSGGQGSRSAVHALAHAHHRLVARVHSVAAEPDARFPAEFTRMVAEVEAGFRHEEALMEAVGFPGLRDQRRDNALLLAALHHALARAEEGSLSPAREAVAALPDLLSLHRFSSLRLLAQQRKGRGHLAGAARRHHHG